MGPSMPVLRTAPVLKVMNAEHLDMLKKACIETQPIELSLESFRVRRIRHAHAGMLELDAVFSSPSMLLMKEHWLSMLGDAVEDLEIRLIDRSMSQVHVPLGRVGAEWGSQMSEFVKTLHEEFLLPLKFSVNALHILEDVSSGGCSVLKLVGKAAQWEKDKRRPGCTLHLRRNLIVPLFFFLRHHKQSAVGLCSSRLTACFAIHRDEPADLGRADRARPQAATGAHISVAPWRERDACVRIARRGRTAAEHHEGCPDRGE